MRRCCLAVLSLFLAVPAGAASALPICAHVATAGTALADHSEGACVPYDYGVYCDHTYVGDGVSVMVATETCVPLII